MQLYFTRLGSGEPLIILHGLLGSSDNWHSISRKLAHQFQVYAVDQRNHGRSPHNAEMNYRVMAEDLNEFLRTEGLASAHLLGHSMGGKTAMQFALLYPHRVRNLIVADIAPRAYTPRHKELLEALLALNLIRFQTRKQIEDALTPAVPDLALRQFALKSLKRNHNGAFEWTIGLHEIRSNNERLRERITSPRPFAGPALFLRGEYSDYLLEDDLVYIRELFPNAILQTIAGAGHLLHVEKPEAFLRRVLDFLEPTASTTHPTPPLANSST